MRYGSVCSGIEAATVAWESLGWTPSWFAEIEPWPSALLNYRYPATANLGDMTRIAAGILSGDIEAPDVLVGGTPCQAFSMAGLRKSLEDDRGQLSIAYIHLADAIESVRASRGLPPPVTIWENVPGVLSTKDNAFGCFLAGLAGEECELQPSGKKWTDAGCVYGPKRTVAWRVLDAQYFGLAQRRKRVFVVASSRKDIDPAAILFESDGLRRDSAPSRETGKDLARCLRARAQSSHREDSDNFVASRMVSFGEYVNDDTASTVKARDHKDATDLVTYGIPGNWIGRQPHNGPNQVTPSIEVSPCLTRTDRHAVAQPIEAIAFDCKASGQSGFGVGDIASTMRAMNSTNGHQNGGGHIAVAVSMRGREGGATAELGDEIQNCLRASSGGGDKPHVLAPVIGWDNDLNASKEQMGTLLKGGDGGRHEGVMLSTMAVRRLTPVECERLQGFPDNYTQIPWKGADPEDCPDGHRYKALGNSMAVPVMRWIGSRIDGAVKQ